MVQEKDGGVRPGLVCKVGSADSAAPGTSLELSGLATPGGRSLQVLPYHCGADFQKSGSSFHWRRRKAIGYQGSGLLKDNRALWPPYSLKGAVRTCLAA